MKDVNIVYVNYLSKGELMNSLSCLLSDLQNSSLDFQITVVDNSLNQDGLREALGAHPSVTYILPEKNLGFGAGNNRGFLAVPARYFMSLNCDTEIVSGSHAIEKMVNFMDNNSKISCIGPKILNMDGSTQFTCYRFDLPSILIKPLKQINIDKKYFWIKKHADKLVMKDFDHNETRPVDWVLGAAMMLRCDVGFFDERYFMYMEDCDLCRSLWSAGNPVYYVHDIVIRHTHNRDSAKVSGLFRAFFKNKLARIHSVSWLKYIWKWRGQHKYYADFS
ncbi:MAG: glycosyltransferase family 2 protein [Patescibacteria group bacterium]